MSGNKIGGAKQSITIKKKYGEDIWAQWGSKGGSTPTRTLKGFAANPETASKVGKIGGRRSRKGYMFLYETDEVMVYRRTADGVIVEFKKA